MEFNGKVARNNGPSNFSVELQLKFLLWDPLGPPRGVHRGVPEGPKGSQRDPEEELRSVFKGKVARGRGVQSPVDQESKISRFGLFTNHSTARKRVGHSDILLHRFRCVIRQYGGYIGHCGG